ncbi:succinylglutamate desuccinylase/aspartoacylase family protein [bacterium]|nr:succinylglutamate desuccinylase/aspartoacylase family protein [bacterium]
MNKKRVREGFSIGGRIVNPGESQTLELDVARLYTHTPITIPVHVISGKNDGPRLFVSAAVHGDEINGVEIIRRLLAQKSLAKLRGILVAVPVVNVHGFISHSRYLPDRRDLNRSFPGNENGSLASRLARLFLREIVDKCTHGIDLHTASGHRFNLPQIRASLVDEETLRLAQAFGPPVILDANIRDGSLRQSVAENGKPFLLYEAGEVLRFDEFSIRVGVTGILSVMRLLGMLPGKPGRNKLKPFVAHSSTWVRAPQSGILQVDCVLGAQVSKGDRLGRISGPMGENELAITAPADGVIIATLKLPLVNKGDAVFHLARLKGSEGDPGDLSVEEEWQPHEQDPRLQ